MSHSAPLIGVSTSITVAKHPERAYMNSAYLHAVQQAGRGPAALPPQLPAPPLEASALTLALRRRLPVLAVCRGIQVLNVALGGSLHQDVGSDPGTQIPHSQTEPRDQPTHKVKVAPHSRLAKTLGTDELEVNSMHHQAIKRLGRGLTAV